MAVTDPDVRLTDRLTEEGAAVISHARIAVDDGFDSYIERLREVYPPPHPAIQIAMEVKAILTTQAESQRDEV